MRIEEVVKELHVQLVVLDDQDGLGHLSGRCCIAGVMIGCTARIIHAIHLVPPESAAFYAFEFWGIESKNR